MSETPRYARREDPFSDSDPLVTFRSVLTRAGFAESRPSRWRQLLGLPAWRWTRTVPDSATGWARSQQDALDSV